MKVLSLFSGVGGFDLGLERAGMETVFQCEWDKHATKILERHWPHVPRWTDVSTLTGEHILNHAPVIDVVAWGSPCQDLSVAGKRAGLQGARSGLFHEGIRIIKELRELTDGQYPRFSIWENVAGALSSGGGADFGQVLYEMDEAGACFSEWRLLDAQYFGVPQRRRRVFVVSVFDSATAARCPDPLLPVSEGVQWDPSTSNQARQTTPSEVGSSLASGSQWPAGANEQGVLRQSISSKWSKGSSGPSGDECINMVVHDEPPILIDRAAFNQGINAQYDTHISDDPVSPSLVARGPHAVFTKSKRPQTAIDDETWVADQPNPTLNAFDQGDTRTTTIVAFGLQGNMIGRQDHNGPQGAGISQPDDPMFSLTSTDRHAVATTMAVRRLTPLECERLMGWPDDWTAGQADSHRYKQCGNGVASPVAQWIAQQLLQLDKEPQ
jgi:DNA (cytosine-5)-methyltransferase 1